MPSFFTAPGSGKKRKRAPGTTEAPKKRQAKENGIPSKPPSKATSRTVAKRSNLATKPSKQAPKAIKPLTKQITKQKRKQDDDESISGSDSESDDAGDENEVARPDAESGSSSGSDSDSDSEKEVETAAEKRLRLAERYLENIKQEVDEVGFDAEDIDRDIIADRLREDAAASKGKVYRQLADELEFTKASHTFFRADSHATTCVATCAPFVYTVSKDMHLIKWKLQNLPKDQYPQTTKKKPKKPPAPPRRRPDRVFTVKGNRKKAKDKDYKGHVDNILSVAASQDGKFVVTCGADRRLIVHDAKTLKPLKVFTHHRDAVTSLAFRRGTNQLYSASKDRTVKVWSLDELAYIETLFGHQDQVLDIDALAQERCISVGARDRTARLWKVVEETQLVFRGGAIDKKTKLDVDPNSLPLEGSMDCVAMIDEDLFVTGSDNGSISLWSIQKKKPLFLVPLAHGLEEPMKPAEASADERPHPEVVPPPQPRWITALRTVPYSDVILSGSWDGHVRAWRLSEDKKKIEAVGVLGEPVPAPGPSHGSCANGGGVSGPHEDAHPTGATGSTPWAIKGIINEISLFERGERGRDGLCVVIAIGKEHRLGKWKVIPNGKNGAVVFEVPRMEKRAGTVNGDSKHDGDAEGDGEEEGGSKRVV